jgi:hypothetical protein
LGLAGLAPRRQCLAEHPSAAIATTEAWETHLDVLGIATEGVLLGGLLEKGLSRELGSVDVFQGVIRS